MDDTVDPPRRTLARDVRRQQVIEATITAIASRGLARLTLSDVAREAAISHGLVLFHFASKENLLSETLAYLADEYQKNWESAVEAAGSKAADRLLALIQADFRPSITTPARLAAWCAFWGEAQSRPFYQQICGERDAFHIKRMEEFCAELVREGGYKLDPVHAARALRLIVEGTWLDMLTVEPLYPPADAQKTVMTVLSLCFPRHFPA